MSVGSNLVGTVFVATDVSEGTVSGSGTNPYAFTETQLLSDQKVVGTPIGPAATATVTSVSTSGGVTTITVVLGNTAPVPSGSPADRCSTRFATASAPHASWIYRLPLSAATASSCRRMCRRCG